MTKVIRTQRLEIKPHKDGAKNAMVELLTNEKIKEEFF